MNSSCFNLSSLTNDSNMLTRFINLYILSTVCFFGAIANFLNILVFINKTMKDISFKYMLALSISDFFYLCFSSFGYVVLCKDCPLNGHYFIELYEIIIDDYFTSCLAIFNILIDIVLSVQRLLLLSNRPLRNESYKYLITIIFIISLIYYMPVLFFKSVDSSIKNDTYCNSKFLVYEANPTQFGSSFSAEIIAIVLTLIRITLGFFVLNLINILNVVIYKKRTLALNRAKALSHSNQSNMKSSQSLKSKKILKYFKIINNNI